MPRYELMLSILLFLFFILFPEIGISESRRTVMVFYPSPYGEYVDLRSKYIAVGSNLMDASLYNSQDGEIHIQSKAVFGDPNDSSHQGSIAYDPSGVFSIDTDQDGSIAFGGTGDISIGSDLSFTSGGKVDANVNDAMTLAVEQTANISVGSDLSVNTGGDINVTDNGAMTLTVGEAGNVSVGSDLSVSAGGDVDISGNNTISLTADGTVVSISPGGVDINKKVTIDSGGADITGDVSINGDLAVNGKLRICT